MTRIVFVNRFYAPDHAATGQLLADLARDQARRGHDVLVITSRPAGTIAADGQEAGVAVRRVNSTRSRSRSVLAKGGDFLSFFVAATWRLLREVRAGDTVVVLTDPPLLSIPATLIARTKGARVVHWIQDIYPEVATAVTGHRAPLLLRPLRNLAWRRAGRCVALSREMAAVVTGAGVVPDHVSVIPNWPPHGLAPVPRDDLAAERLRTAWNVAGKFVVGYSGNLGRVHDLEPIVSAAERLRSRSDLAFVIVGGGAHEARLRARVAERRLDNVHFFPAQPRAQLATVLGAIDLHLVTLLPGCERFVFPSKVYGIVAVGRPMVFVGPPQCELARQVREHDLGLTADGDPARIAEAITTLAGDPVRFGRCAESALRFAESHSCHVALERWDAVLHQSTLAE